MFVVANNISRFKIKFPDIALDFMKKKNISIIIGF